LAWDPSRALGVWGETRSFEELRAGLRALDREKAIFWCARLNLLRRHYEERGGSFDDRVSHLFFTSAEMRIMGQALRRAGEAGRPFMSVFRRRSLLELIRWAALDGEAKPADLQAGDSNISREEGRSLFAAARCAAVQPLRRAIEEHSARYPSSAFEGETPPEFGLPVFRDLDGLRYSIGRRDHLLGRSALLLREAFFGHEPGYRTNFEAMSGLSIDTYLGSVLLMASRTAASVALKPGQKAVQAGLVELMPSDPLPMETRAVIERYLALESQTVDELGAALLKRLPDKSVDENTPFDTTALRLRPWIRGTHGHLILSDMDFLEDKLWIGPIFHLVDKDNARDLFSALGHAVERYVGRLLQSLFERAGKGAYDHIVLGPMAGGEREITDACLRSGDCLLMIETKAVTLREETQWLHGDAAYMRMLQQRLASSGKDAKGVGQLAKAIADLSDGSLRPVDGHVFTGVRRIMPVVLVQDVELGAPMHSAFLADRFIQALERYKPTGTVRRAGKIRLGDYEVYLPTLMTLSDLETIETILPGTTLCDFIDGYYDTDPKRELSVTTLLDGALASRQRAVWAPGSLLDRAGQAMLKSLEEAVSSKLAA